MPETKTPQKFPLCEKYGLEVFGAFPVVDAKDVEQALSRQQETINALKELKNRRERLIEMRDKRIADLEKENKFLMYGASVCQSDCVVVEALNREIKTLKAENKELKELEQMKTCFDCFKTHKKESIRWLEEKFEELKEMKR